MASVVEMLHHKLRSVLPKLGYHSLLPVQEKAIPVILSGRNALIVAPTGSGKTEAAMFPLISRMLERPPGGLGLIYVTPLRALNRDVEVRIRRIAEAVGFRVMTRHGDTGPRDRREFLRNPPEIMVTTPETLGLLLTSSYSRGVWDGVRYIVVDEIHELLESERGSELAVALSRLRKRVGRRLQKVGLSATLSERSIEEAAKLLAGHEHVVVVEDRSTKRYEVTVEVVGERFDEGSWQAMVKRVAEIVEREGGSVLVFVNTRTTAEMLGRGLAEILGEGSVRVHHGSLSRRVREEAERLFREGKVKVLVATSSMELGIDIGHVGLVVQFLSPRQVIAMTQRAGRAGHSIFETSRAVIVTFNNVFETLEAGVIAFRTERGHLEDVRAHRKPLDAAAHQLAGMVLEGSASTIGDALELFNSTYPFSDLSPGELEAVAKQLSDVRVLRLADGGVLGKGSRIHKYYYSVSMIPDEVTFDVEDIVSQEKIGELSSRFIEAVLAKSLTRDEKRPLFTLAGRVWEIIDIDSESMRVLVKPVAEAEGHLPLWEGELIPVDYKVAREVCSMLSLAMMDPERAERLLRARKLEGKALRKILDVARGTVEAWGEPALTPYSPVVEVVEDGAVLYACLGSKGNMALGMLVSHIASHRLSVKLTFDYIPYAIIFRGAAVGESLARAVKSALEHAAAMDRVERASGVYARIRETAAYSLRFIHVAKRFGLIDPEAQVKPRQLERMIESLKGSVVDLETVREIVHDKLDLDALNDFLDNMRNVKFFVLEKPSPLALEVMDNPYLKRDRAVDLKSIALDLLIRDKKRALARRKVILACVRCGYAKTVGVESVKGAASVRCPKCGALTVAPLPDSQWGREAYSVLLKALRGERLRGAEKKVYEELQRRASLMVTYAGQGMARQVVEALLARGVGPSRAVRVIKGYLLGGERRFYEELMKAEEEYAATRRFWKDKGGRG